MISETLEEPNDIRKQTQVPENHENYENEEISINYVMKGIRWNRNKIYVDDKFLYHVTRDIVEHNEDREPVSIN